MPFHSTDISNKRKIIIRIVYRTFQGDLPTDFDVFGQDGFYEKSVVWSSISTS
jgi:hypothetical protein